MTPISSRRCRYQAGTALLEALLSLPVLAAVLTAIVAVNGMYLAKLEAKSRARRLAWLQADSGECSTQTCRSSECRHAETAVRSGGLDRVLEVRGAGFSLRSFMGGLSRHLLGRLTQGVGVAEARTATRVEGGLVSRHGVTTLLCNTRPRKAGDGISVLDHACRTGLETTEYANEVCR